MSQFIFCVCIFIAFSCCTTDLAYGSPPAADSEDMGVQSSAKLKILNEAISKAPGKVETYCDRGRFYADAEDEDKAMADFDRAMKLAPNHPRPYFCRGELYMKMGDWAKAHSDFEKSGDFNKDNSKRAFAYEQAGRALLKQGKYAEAFTMFNKALSMNNDKIKSRILLDRAEAQLALKRPEAAIADIDAMGPVGTVTEGAMAMRATALMTLGKYELAITNLTQAIGLAKTKVTSLESVIFQTNVSTYLKLRANCYEKLGKKDMAILDRRKADAAQEDSLKFAPFR